MLTLKLADHSYPHPLFQRLVHYNLPIHIYFCLVLKERKKEIFSGRFAEMWIIKRGKQKLNMGRREVFGYPLLFWITEKNP